MNISLNDYEKIDFIRKIEINNKVIYIATPNNITRWRADTILTKEKSTIEWISTFKPNEVLFDVGANIGIYSLFSALLRDVNVIAFEPESQNYAQLNKNIYINKISNKIQAFCLALSDKSGFDILNLSSFLTGTSCHSIEEEVGFDLQPRKAMFKQGCTIQTIDNLVQNKYIQPPNHIKIDVDGFEHKVIYGAKESLKNPNLKSLLIEINTNLLEHNDLFDFLKDFGFKYDKEQGYQAIRKEGDFKGVGEFIFYKENINKIQVNKEFKEETNDITESINKLISNIYNSNIKTHPTPYCFIKDIFPKNFYKKMIANFPKNEQLIPINQTGRINNENRFILALDKHLDALNKEQRDFWISLTNHMSNIGFIKIIMEKFKVNYQERFNNKEVNLNISNEWLFLNDKTNYEINPHTDMSNRLFTMIFYLPENEDSQKLGTSFYLPKDKNITCDGLQHHLKEDFDLINTTPFISNSLLIFPRTDTSFHGVEKILIENINRRTLQYIVRIK